jgi:hypothetical protein
LCRKRKPRPNHTKGWFPKEPPTSSPQAKDAGPSMPPDEYVGPSSPPRMKKQAVLKMLTPKKKKTEE